MVENQSVSRLFLGRPARKLILLLHSPAADHDSFFLLVETTRAGLLIKSCWLFGAFVGDADVGRLRQATFWTGLLLRTAFWVWERERFPFQAHWAENWGCWILSPSAPTSVEQAGLRSETRDPSLSKPLHSSAIQGENFFFLVNFAVLPQGPGRSKNFVHVASKQVFLSSDQFLPAAAASLPLICRQLRSSHSWWNPEPIRTANAKPGCLLLLLLLQPGESGGDHSGAGRKRKYSRRTERQLRHSGLLHLLTTRHLHSVCEHCESSSSCCCSCLDLGIFFFFFFFSTCNITTWS